MKRGIIICCCPDWNFFFHLVEVNKRYVESTASSCQEEVACQKARTRALITRSISLRTSPRTLSFYHRKKGNNLKKKYSNNNNEITVIDNNRTAMKYDS